VGCRIGSEVGWAENVQGLVAASMRAVGLGGVGWGGGWGWGPTGTGGC
jgi:hypothetical protein